MRAASLISSPSAVTSIRPRVETWPTISFAKYERDLISERTEAGLAARRQRGERIGRPDPGEVVRRIIREPECGKSFDSIVKALAGDRVLSPARRPTWQPSAVRRIYHSAKSQATERQAS